MHMQKHTVTQKIRNSDFTSEDLSWGTSHSLENSAAFACTLSETEPLGEDPSSDPSCTGEGGWGGET